MFEIIMFKLLIVIYILFYSCIEAYNILGVFPLPAKSHNAVFEPIMIELAKRGHNVTVYTPFVRDVKLPNYNQIDLSNCYKMPDYLSTKSLDEITSASSSKILPSFWILFMFIPAENFRTCKPIIDLVNTDVKYDVFFSETFNTDMYFIFGHLLGIPSIAIVANRPFPWVSNHNGLPEHPGYMVSISHTEVEMTTLYQRVSNTLNYLLSLIVYDYFSRSKGDQDLQNFTKREIPSISEIARNVSMLFLYTNIALSRPRPLPPNVVEIGGAHIKPSSPLPQDIERFINESEHGVVYFCMGSLLRGTSFSSEKRQAFLHAFSKIPQRVLWKWEGEELTGKPKNVMTAKWMPQRDILAHPNVKLFISHGGLLGISEAVYEGVPVLGIPIFGDQPRNVKTIEVAGAGEMLLYQEINNETVFQKIQLILNNQSYVKNAKELSRRYRDRPMSPLDTAVYWTEYVIRHKGAPHLKPISVQMPWYQYLLLDVVAFISAILIIFISIIYYVIKMFIKFIFRTNNTQNYTKKKSN